MSEKEPDSPPQDSPTPSGEGPGARKAGTDTAGAGEDSAGAGEAGPDAMPAGEEHEFLSYEGAVVPRFVALVWLIFIIFAVVYLMRYVPSSWMEWFTRE